MLAKDIKVGGVYNTRVGKSTLPKELVVSRIGGNEAGPVYFCIDIQSHRKIQINGSQRFRSFIRMNSNGPRKLSEEGLKPLEEHKAKKFAPDELEAERRRLKKARKALDEAAELINHKDIRSRVDNCIDRINAVSKSLGDGVDPKKYSKRSIDEDDLDDQRGNLATAEGLLKRMLPQRNGGKIKAQVVNIALVNKVLERIVQVDRFLLGLMSPKQNKDEEEE